MRLAKLTWATPVQVDILGAHLEAYINTLSTTNALKLCNRFGHGSPVTKLPIELILSIADIIIVEERARLREEWSTDFRCFQQQCDPDDHLSEHELSTVKAKVKRKLKNLKITTSSEDDLHKYVEMYLAQDHDEWIGEHDCRVERWEDRAGEVADSHSANGYFKTNKKLIMKHFGLGIHTAVIREPKSIAVKQVFKGTFEEESVTTSAWLVAPPRPSPKRENWHGVKGDCIQLPTRCASTSIQGRFKRALMVLGLEASVNPTEAELDFDEEELQLGDEESEWPKLMVLFRS